MRGDKSANYKSKLIKACIDYCTDSGFTPMVGVVDGGKSIFPPGLAKDGLITFNLGGLAVRSLEIDDELITFDTRFNGVATSVCLHFNDVAWAGSPVGTCMLRFDTGMMSAESSLESETVLATDDDTAVKAARDNLKLI